MNAKWNGMTRSLVALCCVVALAGAGVASAQTILNNNVAVSGVSGTKNSQRFYKIAVPSGQGTLEIKISGGSGDCDLYVKRGSSPSASSWDYRPYIAGNNEAVTVNSPVSGDWFIMLNGCAAYSGVTLSAKFTAPPAVATPTFSQSSGTFNNSVTVSMGCATSGATIRYTTNGNDPTSNSSVYGGPLTLTNTSTLKAKAFKSGMTDSAVATATYTINRIVITTLQNNVPVTNLQGAQGSQAYYKISVPAGQGRLQIGISGGSGDCDLYVQYGTLPSTSSWFQPNGRPYLPGNNETVAITNPAAGDWFIMLRGQAAFSGVTLRAAYGHQYSVQLDNTTIPLLHVGQPVTVSGVIKDYGQPVPNAGFGVDDGISLTCRMVITDACGRFSFATTPKYAKAALVEFTAGGQIFASVSYNVVNSFSAASSLLVNGISIRNMTSSPLRAIVKNPFGGQLVYQIPAKQSQTVVKTPQSIFTFRPTTHTGVQATVPGASAAVTVDSDGVTTVSYTGGEGLLEFSTYTTSQLGSGVCWSPGGEIGAGAGASISGSICLGTDGVTIGGDASLGFWTGGFSIQLVQ